jgi:hypothetical protein
VSGVDCRDFDVATNCNEEVTCEYYQKIKDHLEVITEELKSAYLIIKLLQEEIKINTNQILNGENISKYMELNVQKNCKSNSECMKQIANVDNESKRVKPNSLGNCISEN